MRRGRGNVHDSIGGRNNGRGGWGEEGRQGIRGGGIIATVVLCSLASWSRGRGGAGVSAAKLLISILAAASLLPAGGGQGFGFGFSGSNLLWGH